MTRQRRPHLLAPLEEQILTIVLLQTGREWYRSELARELGVRPSSLQRPLARLRDIEILLTTLSGNRVYYRANTESPLFPEMRGLLAKTSGLAWVLRDALQALASRIVVAFLYGSIAAGEEVSSSDVDLFVVGDVGLSELAPCLRQAGTLLGRDVNPTVFSEIEFGTRVATGERFVGSVLDKAKIFVLGTEDDLREAPRSKKGGRGTDRPR